MGDDTNTKSIWTSIFIRKGGSSLMTRLWEDWDDETRFGTLCSINLQNGELPVIFAKSEIGGLIVLTTRRLLCDSGIASVHHIVSIKPVEFTKKRKEKLNELNVELSSGESFRICIEAGRSYCAFWSVLLHISKRNIRQGRRYD